MRQKREKGRHPLVLDPYGHVRQELINARQAAYGAPQNPQKSPKQSRKRSRKRRSQSAADQNRGGSEGPNSDGEVSLSSADSSPQSSPPAQRSRVDGREDQMSPSAPRVQASGRRVRDM